MSEEQLLQNAYEKGYTYELERGACVQCVLAAVFDSLDDWDDEVFKSSYGLAGGCALTSEGTCGALSGGVIAISHHFGRTREEFSQGRKERCYELSKELYDRFVAEYGSLICKDVQVRICGRSFNFWDIEDAEEYEKNRGHRELCPGVVGNVSRWALEIIRRERPESAIP